MKLYDAAIGMRKAFTQGGISGVIAALVSAAVVLGLMKEGSGQTVVEGLPGFMAVVGGIALAVHGTVEWIRNWLKITRPPKTRLP